MFSGAATVLSLMMGELKTKVLPCDINEECALNTVYNLTETNNFTIDATNIVRATDIGSSNAFLVGIILVLSFLLT